MVRTHTHLPQHKHTDSKLEAELWCYLSNPCCGKRVTSAISAGELENIWRVTCEDKRHLVSRSLQSIILVVPILHVDSVVVFSSICLQFRAMRGHGGPRHEYMNKYLTWRNRATMGPCRGTKLTAKFQLFCTTNAQHQVFVLMLQHFIRWNMSLRSTEISHKETGSSVECYSLLS